MAALLKADKLIRSKVAEINQDQRDAYPSFSEALLEVLDNHRYLWNEARSFARARSRSPEKTASPFKKLRTEEGHQVVEHVDGGPKRVGKSAKRNAKLKARLADLSALIPVVPRPSSMGTPKGAGKGAANGHKVPADEWAEFGKLKKLDGKCKFFNTSGGCKFGKDCKQAHDCAKCGGNHSWCSQCR